MATFSDENTSNIRCPFVSQMFRRFKFVLCPFSAIVLIIIYLTASSHFQVRFPLEWLLNHRNYVTNGNTAMVKTVMIYARERTGSTFTSEFFNRHKNGFYIFEPLQYVNLSIIQEYGMDITKDFLQCRVHTSVRNITNPNSQNKCYKTWIRDRFCTIKSPDLCANFSVARMQAQCNKSAIRVTKVIRFHSVQSLDGFVRDGAHVIILLRDPRGMMASRLRTAAFRYSETKSYLVYNEAGWYCHSMLRDVDYVRSLPEEQQKSYLVVRYEDLASKPVWGLRTLYRFVGVKEDQSVTNWVLDLMKYHPNANETDGGTWRKNASASSQMWRSQLNYTMTREVQDACQLFMQRFGYFPVNSSVELLDYSRNIRTPGYS